MWPHVCHEEAENQGFTRDPLLQGAEHADSAQDRAMFLYRAAKMRFSRMGDSAGARELYARAASLYPRTVYGRKAARME